VTKDAVVADREGVKSAHVAMLVKLLAMSTLLLLLLQVSDSASAAKCQT